LEKGKITTTTFAFFLCQKSKNLISNNTSCSWFTSAYLRIKKSQNSQKSQKLSKIQKSKTFEKNNQTTPVATQEIV